MRMFKILVLTFIFFNFAGQVYAAADSAYDLNVNVQTFQLGNGMLFLVVERPATPQVAIRLAIRAGSALEGAGKTGIAHLLEHMLFWLPGLQKGSGAADPDRSGLPGCAGGTKQKAAGYDCD